MGSAPADIGDVIADKYSVERVIGEGGMGVVYAARHLELDQRVAIKFLLPEIATQGMAAERFRREARAAAKIRGEHVCRVLDVGTLRGIPYMVMEFLDGRDLANELERRGRLPPEEAVGYVLEACDAVAEAHAAGIVHRDLKPANLFLATRSDGSRHIKVLDFGVSKSLVDSSSGQHALTVTSSVVGSPLYMSPEQLDSAKDVDRRTDIWALGVVLFELITGRTPFRGDSIPQLVSSVLHDKPPSFSLCEVTAPDGLEVALHKALAKPREQRYASVAELVSSLAPYAPRLGAVSLRMSRVAGSFAHSATDSQPITEVGATATTQAASVSLAPAAPWAQRTTDRGRRSTQRILLVALVFLCGLGFLAYRFARESGGEPAMGASDQSMGLQPAPVATPTPPSEPKESPAPVEVAEPTKAAAGAEPVKPSPSEAAAAPASPVAPTGAIVAAPTPPGTPRTGAAPPPAQAVWPRPVKKPVLPPAPGAPATTTPPPAPPPASPSNISDFGGRR